MSEKLALITGASSGIGLEFAKVFANEGFDLVLVARRKSRLDKVKESLSGVKIAVIPIDLTVRGSAEEVFSLLKAKRISVDVLVNNAGFGLHGNFFETNLITERNMIDLNIKALVSLSKEFLLQNHIRAQIENPKKDFLGGIINVSSTAAFMPGYGSSVYYATKAFVLQFGKAIRHELADAGIRVTTLCPGLTHSEFHDIAGGGEPKRGIFRFMYMDAHPVARAGFDGFMERKAVVIPGIRNKAAVIVMKSPFSSLLRNVRLKIEKEN